MAHSTDEERENCFFGELPKIQRHESFVLLSSPPAFAKVCLNRPDLEPLFTCQDGRRRSQAGLRLKPAVLRARELGLMATALKLIWWKAVGLAGSLSLTGAAA
jgi:hypothetical protein